MRNLFILNGMIPVIVATTLIEREFQWDENIVILEYMHAADSQGRLSSSSYQQLTELLASIIPTAATLTCDIPTTLTEFREKPLVALQEARIFMAKAEEVAKRFPGRFDRIIYSGNSRILWGLHRKADRLICIEHGYGEYVLTLPGRRLRLYRFLQRQILRLFSGASDPLPDEIVLTDGGECRSYRQTTFQGAVVRHIAPPNISDIFARFSAILQAQEPAFMAALMALQESAARYDQVYLYLPQFTVAPQERKTLIQEQLKALKPAEALFIVKSHPRDTENYLDFFQQLGVEAVEIAHPLARNVPAEFILELIPNAQPVACVSATLFYAMWWMKRSAWCLCGETVDLIPALKLALAYFAQDIARQDGRPVT